MDTAVVKDLSGQAVTKTHQNKYKLLMTLKNVKAPLCNALVCQEKNAYLKYQVGLRSYKLILYTANETFGKTAQVSIFCYVHFCSSSLL